MVNPIQLGLDALTENYNEARIDLELKKAALDTANTAYTVAENELINVMIRNNVKSITYMGNSFIYYPVNGRLIVRPVVDVPEPIAP